MGVCFKVAMVTTEKMVSRQPITIHLRFTRTRKDSPRGDSCGGRSAYRRGDRSTSTPADGRSSPMTALFARTRGPESMPGPQRFFNCSKAHTGHLKLKSRSKRLVYRAG